MVNGLCELLSVWFKSRFFAKRLAIARARALRYGSLVDSLQLWMTFSTTISFQLVNLSTQEFYTPTQFSHCVTELRFSHIKSVFSYINSVESWYVKICYILYGSWSERPRGFHRFALLVPIRYDKAIKSRISCQHSLVTIDNDSMQTCYKLQRLQWRPRPLLQRGGVFK